MPAVAKICLDKALGCQIMLDNRNTVELNQRLDAAWNAFYKLYDTVSNKNITIQVRISFLEKRW